MRKRRKNLIGAFTRVWREDFLLAWGMVRRNGGAAGVDGVTVADVGAYGVERLGELSRELRDGAESGATGAHPEEAAGEVPSPGHPMPGGPGRADVGDAGPDADLRGGSGAGAVRIPAGTKRQGRGRRIHRLLHGGRNEVLSNYFGRYRTPS